VITVPPGVGCRRRRPRPACRMSHLCSGAALRGEQLTDDAEQPPGNGPCHPQPIVVDDRNPVVHRQCDVCRDGRVFVRQTEWAAHCKSRQHAKMTKRQRRDRQPHLGGCSSSDESSNRLADGCANAAVPPPTQSIQAKPGDASVSERPDEQGASGDRAAELQECSLGDLSSLPQV